MGMKINTNVSAINAQRTLSKTTGELKVSLQRLSSGLRINSAKDDAAGLAIAEAFRSQVNGSDVAQRNAQDGISMSQTAEGALVEVTNMLQRMRELAVQSANGTQSTANRTSLNNEVTQLEEQIDSIANSTEFNGYKLLDGTNATVVLQVGYRNVAGATMGNQLTVTMQSATTAVLGANVDISSQGGAQGAITTLDTAIDAVNSRRANLGAIQNRLDYTINNLAVQEENAAASESAIRDADIAEETISFTRAQILVSSGTSVLAQANIIPQNALTLLG